MARLRDIFFLLCISLLETGNRCALHPLQLEIYDGRAGCKELWGAAARIWLPFALEERWLENGRASAATRRLFVAAIPWNWWYRYIPNLSLCLLSAKVHMAAPATPAEAVACGRPFFLFTPPNPSPTHLCQWRHVFQRQGHKQRHKLH